MNSVSTMTGCLPVVKQRGFTYLLVLFAVAIVGAGLAVAGQVWSTAQQQENEQELLFVGNQFRQAIGMYYEKSPGGAKRFPPSLEDLLKDPRYPGTQRYLRKIYVDPITGTQDWGLITAPTGGIMGVYSKSEKQPLKVAGFDPAYVVFEERAKLLGEKMTYQEWQFVYVPPAAPSPAVSGRGPSPAR